MLPAATGARTPKPRGCDANIDTIYDDYDNAGQDELYWNPKADLTYDLIRGDLANLALMGGLVDLCAVTCEQQIIGSGSIIDVSPAPAPWQGWFFLLRDHVTPGNYGLDSSGRERVPASGDCP
jgi:hypothetical protein